MNDIPLALCIYPKGTGDKDAFLHELELYTALKDKIHFYSCDQSAIEIEQNTLKVVAAKPTFVILSSSMPFAIIDAYTKLLWPHRHSFDINSRFLHYDNGDFSHPDISLRNYIDEYYPSIGMTLQVMLNSLSPFRA